MSRSRPLFGRAAGAVAFDDEQLGFAGVGAIAVVELARQIEPAADWRLATDLRSGGAAGLARLGGLDHSRRDRVSHALVLEQEVFEGRTNHRLDLRLDLGVVEPALGLTLELRLANADRQHGCQPFADVLTLDFHPFLDEVVRLHEPLHGRADRGQHPHLVRAAVTGWGLYSRKSGRPRRWFRSRSAPDGSADPFPHSSRSEQEGQRGDRAGRLAGD